MYDEVLKEYKMCLPCIYTYNKSCRSMTTAWGKNTNGKVVSKSLTAAGQVSGLWLCVPFSKGIQKGDLEVGGLPLGELFSFYIYIVLISAKDLFIIEV